MRKFTLDKGTSTRISALVLAGFLTLSPFVLSSCSKSNVSGESKPQITSQNDETKKMVSDTREGIKCMFPTMNKEIIDNTSLIILLDELAKEDANGKIDSKVISNFKSKIDTDNMMSDFNSFLDTLEQAMIENESLIATNHLVLAKDKEILSKIEKITSNVINGTEEEKQENFDLLYTLFVEEDEITFDGLTFDVRDLSYSGRAIASAYARTSAYFAKDYITEEEYSKIDARTNNQNNKAYIKTKLEILSNDMEEKSLVDVNKLFNDEYTVTTNTINGKVSIEQNDIKNLVNYLNLEYLDSDKVSNQDKNAILGDYTEEKVTNTLIAIDAITEYNLANNNDIILFSNLLVDDYKETETGKLDKVTLDYIQFNSIMFLNTTTEQSTKEELYNNVYFQNLYKYFTKQNFTHRYDENTEVNVNYQGVSDGTKLIANEIIYYTLNKRSNVFEYVGFEEKITTNLEETIQYVQNTVTGECEKVEVNEFVKIK